MTITGTELLKFVGVKYELEHKKIPGCFSVRCLIKEFGGWRERERSWTFQYDSVTGNVYFRAYPEEIKHLIGNAVTKEDAAEQAKKFLKLWLEDSDFHRQKRAEIDQL